MTAIKGYLVWVIEFQRVEIKYNCPNDCVNQLLAGGAFDNPQLGGCYVDDKFPDDIPITLEEDNNLPLCPFYEKGEEANYHV